MMRNHLSLVAATWALACSAHRLDASIYAGIGNGSALNPGALATLNEANASGAIIGDTITPGGLSGLAFNSAGVLWGTTISSGSSSLVSINPSTGALISSAPIGLPIGDLAVQPGTNVLFGIRSNADFASLGGLLYTIDTTTGAPTLVGDTGQGRGGGLAFAPDGTLYFAEFVELHTLNPATAAVLTTVAITGGANPEGLGIRPSDSVLFTTQSGTNDAIYTLALTGVSTFVGNTGIGSPSDLAFAPSQNGEVPEPLSFVVWSLLGITCGATLWRRRE